MCIEGIPWALGGAGATVRPTSQPRTIHLKYFELKCQLTESVESPAFSNLIPTHGIHFIQLWSSPSHLAFLDRPSAIPRAVTHGGDFCHKQSPSRATLSRYMYMAHLHELHSYDMNYARTPWDYHRIIIIKCQSGQKPIFTDLSSAPIQLSSEADDVNGKRILESPSSKRGHATHSDFFSYRL